MSMIEADLDGRFSLVIGGMQRLGDAMDRDHAWRLRVQNALTRVPFAGSVALSAGAGTDDQPDKLQAKTGYMWSVRRLTFNGFTAGTVTVYRNNTAGEPLIPYPATAVNTFGKGEILLLPNDRMVMSATGITGTVSYWGEADCFESWFLPFYIG